MIEEVYLKLVQAGKRTLEEVPINLRQKVTELYNAAEAEKESAANEPTNQT